VRFEHPHLLWSLIVVLPGLTGFLWWAWRKKQRLISQFVQSRLLAQLTVGVSKTRQKLRLALMVGAVALLVLVLARPQWGFDWQEARQRGLDIIVAIDTSRSMLARDVSPNRLERAKLAALDLVKMARTDRLGLVAFAGGAFLQCPLSVDDEAFRQSLDAIDTSIIPQGGTALAEAIRTALAGFEKDQDNYKVLVLFTDGEDHDGHAVEAAREAEKEGMRIFTIGVGTPNGELISVPNGQGGSEFIKDEKGQVVKSRLDENLLRQIAEAAHGFYMLLSGANTLEVLYERGLAPLPKSEFSTRQIKRYHERYQWFLGLALVLLLIEMFLPDQKRVPRSATALSGSAPEPLGRAFTLFLWFLLPATALQASSGQALKHYDSGRFEAARLQYERMLRKKPDDPRLHFNIGDAAYQSQDFQDAAKHFQSSLVTSDLGLQERAYYNLGNTHYRIGADEPDPQKKREAWEQAVTHYKSALELDPKDEDAKFNLDFVQKKLEELTQQQKQNQNKQDKNKDQKDQDQKQQQQQQQQQKDQEKQGQNSKEDQQKQQQEKQQPKPSEQKEGQKPDEKKAQQGEKKDDEKNQNQPGQTAQLMQMTPEQAKRLLESLKDQQRTLIFLPQTFTNRNRNVPRNW
jgi:Ca-activated chloride channel homolog